MTILACSSTALFRRVQTRKFRLLRSSQRAENKAGVAVVAVGRFLFACRILAVPVPLSTYCHDNGTHLTTHRALPPCFPKSHSGKVDCEVCLLSDESTDCCRAETCLGNIKKLEISLYCPNQDVPKPFHTTRGRCVDFAHQIDNDSAELVILLCESTGRRLLMVSEECTVSFGEALSAEICQGCDTILMGAGDLYERSARQTRRRNCHIVQCANPILR